MFFVIFPCFTSELLIELWAPSQKNAAVATAIIHGDEIPYLLLLFCHCVLLKVFYGFFL